MNASIPFKLLELLTVIVLNRIRVEVNVRRWVVVAEGPIFCVEKERRFGDLGTQAL